MKTFNEYVLSWWKKYLENSTEETARAIMENEFIGDEEGVDDYIPSPNCEAESCREWLALQDDAERIYKTFFGIEGSGCYDNLPDTETFLTDMFRDCAGWFDCCSENSSLPSFVEDFVPDMAYHAQHYETPLGFFKDLQHGCVSGMIDMLIYNIDCKRIYIKHIDDMEEYKEQIEGECGPISNRHNAPHYTFMCWLCYEELGYQIGRALFPETF